MHQLFRLVLGQRDLSRAGDLFSLDNSEIEDCLSQVLDEIRSISRSPDYLTNDNDQAVVEICITRITTAIRETGSIEKHGAALVALWESCLEHNLQPQGKDEDTPHEDTPHAKIASDITSCILQNYSRVPVMTLAVPVAMRFLQHSNRELCRNMSSYLSLTAIANAELLIQHTEAIALSVLGGNSMLLRVLPSMYPLQPEPIHRHILGLVAMVTEMKPSSRQHLLRLLQMISEQNPLTLSPLVPFLIGHLSDDTLNDALLAVLVGVAQASPASLRPFLTALRSVGQQSPGLLGYVAKIHGAVGLTSEAEAREALLYLVSLLSCMEHSIHHTLLLEIHSLTNHYPSLLGGGARDIYRMSNSFSAMARLLSHRLEGDAAAAYRGANDSVVPRRCEDQSGPGGDDDDGDDNDDEGRHLQVKIQAFDEEAGRGDTSPGPQRHQSLGQASRAEHREMRFSRSKSLAIHAARSHCTNPDGTLDGEGVEQHPEASLNCPAPSPVGGVASPPVQENHSDPTERPPSSPMASQGDAGPREVTEPQEGDRLWKFLRDNMEKIRAFCLEMIKQIPIPEKCTIEARQRGCVAKLSFSCPLKGHYCLYGKSCFSVCSPQPHVWIRVMLLTLQSKSSAVLSGEDVCVQQLQTLWEQIQTQLKDGDSFEQAMTQTASPDKKDLARLQVHLEEVRFFDLFGYSEEEGGWLCFMCNNPEKASVVNQDGQPLIEGKLKEKQVRWKFLKRWKTRYFTLAGNQLLFRKAKSDKLDDNGIELIKVQSVKAVARKRRQCGLPRAFEIFTDTKTYVLKACDEDHAEEWLRCISVAVARAKECESREATTYL